VKRSPINPGDKPLQRKTQLRSVPMPQQQGAPRERRPSKARKPGVAAAEKRTRGLVLIRSDGWCEIGADCRGRARATNMSHRKASGRGGLWCPSNVLAACGMGNVNGCHGRVHANRDQEAYTAGWAVATSHVPAECPVWLFRHGWVLLDEDGGMRRTAPPHQLAA
jgi:hypothetical protein